MRATKNSSRRLQKLLLHLCKESDRSKDGRFKAELVSCRRSFLQDSLTVLLMKRWSLLQTEDEVRKIGKANLEYEVERMTGY